jgi:electron transport complex protein RnfB
LSTTPAAAGRETVEALVRRIDAVLPQTQCTRCGYPDCATYAQAVATKEAPINQCPPGGDEGIQRLAHILGVGTLPLNPVHGVEAPRSVAFIDESWCIGCTLCIKACPTDAIVGANKLMHTVMEAYCTGCELCVPACPVDCIQLEPASGTLTGWNAWSEAQAQEARERYAARKQRLAQGGASDASAAEIRQSLLDEDAEPEEATSATPPPQDAAALRRAAIAAAMERARQLRKGPPSSST